MVPLENTKRVTVKDVARAAGVSTQTVSRVVNDYAFVSKKDRQQVRDLLRSGR